MTSQESYEEVDSIGFRHIWNSHLDITSEFWVTLKNGHIGIGASPQGETISIYEDKVTRRDTADIVASIHQAGITARPLTQRLWDEYLHANMGKFGRNNCWALSLAFFNATHFPPSCLWITNGATSTSPLPRLCLNILNGGMHAYTNPVLSDFPEFLVVPTQDDIFATMMHHARIQDLVRQRLSQLERTQINNNWVHQFRTRDNRECLDFLTNILETLQLDGQFMLMIDASAGDLYHGHGYRFSLTDQCTRTTTEMLAYWQNLAREYRLGFLEDPFGEEDYDGWAELSRGAAHYLVIGDNFYSSDPERLERGACKHYSHGAIIKPNQAGSVTAVERALDVCYERGLLAIASHRSISTESVFLSTVTMLHKIKYMKIGPLVTDYSSVMRLNELIRLSGVRHE